MKGDDLEDNDINQQWVRKLNTSSDSLGQNMTAVKEEQDRMASHPMQDYSDGIGKSRF